MIERANGPPAPSERVRVESVGEFELTMAAAAPSPEAAECWSRRVEALNAWLLSVWQREHAEGTRQMGGAGDE